MKIWVKYLIGLVIGTACGIIFSQHHEAALSFIKPVTTVFINVGRYSFYPLVFFSVSIGTHELLLNKKFMAVHLKAIALLVISSLLFTAVGAAAALIFSPERIPVFFQRKEVILIPGFFELLLAVFPKNLFNLAADSGNYILPVAFFALIFGINFNFDKIITKPVVHLFDSFNRIFYHLNSLIIEIMAPAMGFFSAFLVFTISSIDQIALYKQLFLIIFVNTVLIVFIIIPGILYLIGFKENPYKHIYGLTGAAIAAFMTGDNYLGSSVLIKHAHENLGVPRQSGASTLSAFLLFGRAGTAFITAICFILILKSYTSIEIGFLQVLKIILFIFLISFTLPAVPAQGVLISLVIMSTIYRQGIDDGYLILTPVMPFLISFAAFIDIIVAGISSMIIAWSENLQKDTEIRDYI